jgi:hypothetical protein
MKVYDMLSWSQSTDVDATGLRFAKIFSAIISEDAQTIELEECCDYYYRETLDKQGFQILIDKMQFVCNQMKDVK